MFYLPHILRSKTQNINLDPATQALLDQAAIDGFTPASGGVLIALDTFIKTQKSLGLWNSSDLQYLFATNGDYDFASYNLKDPTQFFCDRIGHAPTFTSLQGVQGNATDQYLDTGWKPSIDGFNFTLNNAGVCAYVRTAVANANVEHVLGCRFTASTFVRIHTKDNRWATTVNSSNNSTQASLGTAGFIQSYRSSSSVNQIKVNTGSFEGFSTTSGGLSLTDLWICGFNGNTILTQPGAQQISFVWVGDNQTANATSFYNAIQTYMTALGTEV